MALEDEICAVLAEMRLPVPDDEHKRNAEIAASYAPDLLALNAWERGGADEDDPQEVEVVAVAHLPDGQRALLSVIAAAGNGEQDGDQRRLKRVAWATQVDPVELRTLVVWMSQIIDWLQDGEDDGGDDNDAPALRPRPRRRRNSYSNS